MVAVRSSKSGNPKFLARRPRFISMGSLPPLLPDSQAEREMDFDVRQETGDGWRMAQLRGRLI